jgi:hypothetical protein
MPKGKGYKNKSGMPFDNRDMGLKITNPRKIFGSDVENQPRVTKFKK